MDTRKLAALLLSAVLTGCVTTPTKPVVKMTGEYSEYVSYNNRKYNYSVQIPNNLYTSLPSATGASVGFINYDHWKFPPPSDGYFIGIDALSSPCSPSLTGASHTTPLPNAHGESEWGKVDVFELQRLEGWQPEYDLSTVLCTSSLPVVYALCSTNGVNTVVMCISEQTDNPALAKQIFETFRWTK